MGKFAAVMLVLLFGAGTVILGTFMIGFSYQLVFIIIVAFLAGFFVAPTAFMWAFD